ncbi:hypothetical protein HMPREF1544_03062 [Mucor circinelloides 1006PhL]|uniref:Cytochrome P450 n=1 Tax=Mucor circinelloides f. circinelloides (strain 1006PhL) TaxID=1220926 RepID=S2JIE8_MUCC1|nr:hypothetical protein HMPREF1544_03062 [Mucor circinelloides 1006PhL]
MQSAANGKLAQRIHFNFGFERRLCPGAYLADVKLFNTFVQVFAICKMSEFPKESILTSQAQERMLV